MFERDSANRGHIGYNFIIGMGVADKSQFVVFVVIIVVNGLWIQAFLNGVWILGHAQTSLWLLRSN
jgi:hypothetical protein